MLNVFGHFLAIALFMGVLRANARRWQYLAESYSGDAGPPLEKRKMRSAILIGMGAFNSLKGIVTIGVHQHGVSFRMMPIFSLFHKPIIVPYSDIRGWRTTWFLDARSTELEFRCAPAVKVVLPEEDAEWIRSHAGDTMTLNKAPPPEGRAGRGWHAVLVIQAVVSIAVLSWFVGYFFLR